MASESEQSSDDEMQAVVYTCRKCSGLQLKKEELDEHREYHRSLREKKRARAERQKRRGGSAGAPSTLTTATSDLFTHREVERPGTSSQLRPAERSRLRKAKNKYKKGAEKTIGVRYKGV